MEKQIKKLQDMINECNNIVFFGGAGVSTASGIPDFRSKDGLYNQHDVQFEKFTAEYLLSSECLHKDTDVFFEFYRQKLDTRGIQPNITHYKLAELEKAGKLKAIVTQNIDGLHQKAGSKTVYEIHGTTQRNYCTKCKMQYHEDFIFDTKEKKPTCECGGIIRPDVTLFGEMLPEEAVNNALAAIYEADMLIIAGTSLNVYPAADFINHFHGKYLVIINKEWLGTFKQIDLFIEGDMTEVFDKITC